MYPTQPVNENPKSTRIEECEVYQLLQFLKTEWKCEQGQKLWPSPFTAAQIEAELIRRSMRPVPKRTEH